MSPTAPSRTPSPPSDRASDRATGRSAPASARGSAPGSGPSSPAEAIGEVVRQVKPRLRGWLHAGITPLALAAGIVLICVAPTGAGKLGGAVFLAASLLLFGTSGIYHRFYWGPRGEAVLRRMDHANIFVFIAATYTPMALTMLAGQQRTLLLALIWGAAAAGLAFRLLWLSAPRWLYTVLYLVAGWTALWWLPSFWRTGGPAVVVLILAGGLFYTVGALVYARKRPDPSPAWFGFHEVFHACTIAAFVLHYVAISIATYSA